MLSHFALLTMLVFSLLYYALGLDFLPSVMLVDFFHVLLLFLLSIHLFADSLSIVAKNLFKALSFFLFCIGRSFSIASLDLAALSQVFY